jgi:Zn finger protein HypA/HybF involved in hydrogenase expression
MNIYEYAERYGEHVSDIRRESLENVDTRCNECGTEFDAGYIPATRFQPAEHRYEECPSCGSGDLTDL